MPWGTVLACPRQGKPESALTSIMGLWGIHLTGVSDLPPWATRRRSLQAGPQDGRRSRKAIAAVAEGSGG
jgi:hypothetical protein